MAQVYVGVGSNIDPQYHIVSALDHLARRFGRLQISPVYKTPAQGFEGDDFHNLVVGLETGLDPIQIYVTLRAIEAKQERIRTEDQFISRTLDLDQLLYDDLVFTSSKVSLPDEDILRYPFVLKPLADIAGEVRHPIVRRSFATLWTEFERENEIIMQPVSHLYRHIAF